LIEPSSWLLGRVSAILAFVLFTATSACDTRGDPGGSTPAAETTRQLLVRRAHVEGLIFDPIVADSVRALAIRRRDASPEQRERMERAFARWLDSWASANPDRAARAADHARRLPGFAGAVDPATGQVQARRPGAEGRTPR
jgi:hypothetical protein